MRGNENKSGEGLRDRAIGDLLREKAFLGQEFLTWLWWRSEERGGVFRVKGIGDVQVEFVRFVTIEGGVDDARESITCRGVRAQLREVKIGLGLGKKVSRARISVNTGRIQWEVTILGNSLDFQGLRVQKGLDEEDELEGEDLKGVLMERVFLLREITGIIDSIFVEFMGLRSNPSLWSKEKEGLSSWIRGLKNRAL